MATTRIGRASVIWLVLPCVVLSSSCCTLAGAGIGYAIPRHGDAEKHADIRVVPKGTDVTVFYRAPERAGVASSTVEGVYRGTNDDRAIVDSGFQSYSIPLSRITETEARPISGSYSLEGGLIGVGLDVAIFASLLWMASHWEDERL